MSSTQPWSSAQAQGRLDDSNHSASKSQRLQRLTINHLGYFKSKLSVHGKDWHDKAIRLAAASRLRRTKHLVLSGCTRERKVNTMIAIYSKRWWRNGSCTTVYNHTVYRSARWQSSEHVGIYHLSRAQRIAQTDDACATGKTSFSACNMRVRGAYLAGPGRSHFDHLLRQSRGMSAEPEDVHSRFCLNTCYLSSPE